MKLAFSMFRITVPLALAAGVGALGALPIPRAALFGSIAAAQPDPRSARLVCATGVRVNGRYGTLVHLTLAVPEGADADEIARDALAREGARPVTASSPSGDFSLRWQRFFDHIPGNNLVPDLYNPEGQNFAGAADAEVAAAGQTWTDVPTATFALGLGGDTSAQTGFDGLNVVTWPVVWSHGAGALAITVTTFDGITGFILDADVEFNRAFPFSLDPQPSEFAWDFQRVLLHEDGHVAGLEHSADPTAVMFPFLGPGPERHTLARDDIDAIATLYPHNFNMPTQHPQPPPNGPPLKTEVIARLGDPAPGGGLYDFDFEPYRLNDRGQVAFAADFFDPVSFDGGEGAFVADGPLTRPLARSADHAPGGGTFGLGVWVNIGLTEQGDAAFAFALDPFSRPGGMNSGVYRWDAARETLAAIVVPGVTLSPTGGAFLGAYNHADLDDRGQVAFAGIIPTDAGIAPGLGMGVFLARPDGTIGTVAAPGDPAPGGGVFDFADVPALDPRGDVAFGGHVRGEECVTRLPQTREIHCDESLYLWRANGEIVPLVHAGDAAPGGGSFRSAFDPVLNAAGDALFLGDLTPPPGRRRDIGVFLWRGGSITAIARPGQDMPGGGHLVRTALQYGNWSLNAGGDAVFSALLDTDTLGFGSFDMGLYLWSGGSLQLIARTGMQFPDLGALVKLAPPAFFVPFSGALLNGRGDVVFQGTFADQNFNMNGVLLKVSKQ